MRLATYNVQGFPWLSTPIGKIAAWITQNCDVAALQEVWARHAEWTAAFAAQGWTLVTPARESHFATMFGSGLAVAFPANRWTIQDTRFFPFLRCAGLDVFATKGWFRVDLLDARGPVRIINTHMQAEFDIMGWLCPDFTEGIRREQARQLTGVEDHGIIVGDFNTGENWFQGFRLIRGTVLDHAAVPVRRAWMCKEKRVGSDAKGWSDHLPVTFFLRRE